MAAAAARELIQELLFAAGHFARVPGLLFVKAFIDNFPLLARLQHTLQRSVDTAFRSFQRLGAFIAPLHQYSLTGLGAGGVSRRKFSGHLPAPFLPARPQIAPDCLERIRRLLPG